MSDFLAFNPDDEDIEIINREVIEHEEPITDRSLARRVALQCLYEIDSVGHPLGEVLASNINYSPERRRVRAYIVLIVKTVTAYREAIDSVLQKFASEFPIGQVAVVDRNILRIALFEMGLDTRTPVGVAIDEAIELSKLFGAENTSRFVNGVLGTVADNLDAVKTYFEAHVPAAAIEAIVEEDEDIEE